MVGGRASFGIIVTRGDTGGVREGEGGRGGKGVG